MNNFIYTGHELEVFKLAKNWKNYYKNSIKDHILDGPVLEIGAGIGEITKLLKPLSPNSKWVCIEPDKKNSEEIIIANKEYELNVEVFHGKLSEFESEIYFSTVLMIDCLEHIEDDNGALRKINNMLITGGILIIIVPAHNFLYSEFDKEIGHFRRYNKNMLNNILPNSILNISIKYIDCAGFFLSLANKLFLKSGRPSLRQIKFWDKVIVPISLFIDSLIGYRFGKNLIFIGRKS